MVVFADVGRVCDESWLCLQMLDESMVSWLDFGCGFTALDNIVYICSAPADAGYGYVVIYYVVCVCDTNCCCL